MKIVESGIRDVKQGKNVNVVMPVNLYECELGDDVTVGSGATILTTEICSGAVPGAGSVVIKPVTIKGVYAGNPAKLLREL